MFTLMGDRHHSLSPRHFPPEILYPGNAGSSFPPPLDPLSFLLLYVFVNTEIPCGGEIIQHLCVLLLLAYFI